MSHLLLVVFWVAYCALHSILAATPVKEFFKKKLRENFRYYRLSYSIFGAVTLGCLLYYQYSFDSPLLIKSLVLKYFSLIVMVVPGLLIMFIALNKYFMLLSGIRSLYEPSPPVELKVEGIHRYVRHPLYSGTILLVWGLFFIFPRLNNLIAAVLLTLYVRVGIGFEERKLLKEFGNKYQEYIRNVPMLIPRFRPRK